MTKETKREAWWYTAHAKGVEDRLAGKSLNDNPYEHPETKDAWRIGWQEAPEREVRENGPRDRR